MPLLYLNVKAAMDKKLASLLPDCKGVAFTGDFWTSCAAEQYLGMTMHFADKDFNLHTVMVACKSTEGRHTAINIAGHFDKVVSSSIWQLGVTEEGLPECQECPHADVPPGEHGEGENHQI